MPRDEQLSLLLDRVETQKLIDGIPTTREKFTISEVARFLRCTEHHIYNLIYIGALPAVNIATKPQDRAMYRIYRADLIKFLESRKEGAA